MSRNQLALGSSVGSSDLAGILLGQRIEVDGKPAWASLSPDVGRNAAFVGPGNCAAPIASAVLSLAWRCSGRVDAEFLFAGFLKENREWDLLKARLYSELRHLGFRVAPVGISDLESSFGTGAPSAPQHENSMTVLVGVGLDRCEISPALQEVFRWGPGQGIHTIGWWRKPDAFYDKVGYGSSNYFEIKAAYGLDTQSTRRFMDDPLLDWKPHDNRMAVWDSGSMPGPVSVIPYLAQPQWTVGESPNTI